MTVSVVWLDREHAKLFHFSEEKMERETCHASRHDHHTHKLDQNEYEDVTLYDSVANKLQNAKRILILGPGTAKTHFLTRLKERYSSLAKRVVGCETTDHPTDGQIAAYAMKYFKKSVA